MSKLNKKFKYKMMIDFETLDVEPTAKVLSCGIVLFNKGGIWEEVYWEFNLDGQEDRTVRQETIDWWIKTNNEKYERLLEAGDKDIADLTNYVSELCANYGISELWSRGYMDIAILKNIMGDKYPFPYNRERDARTLDSLGSFGKSMSANNHNALDDARNQANHVTYIMNVVWKNKKSWSA